jgi:Bacterial membrane protein YfhO
VTALSALLLFVALHGVFFFDVMAGGRSLSAASFVAGVTPRGPVDAQPTADAPHVLDVEGAAWVDEPSPYLAHAAFVAGELPLWNPATGLGAPLAANLNSGAANPLQLGLNIVPSAWHADLFYLGRLLLLACFTCFFLREIGLSWAAAWLGASIVAYGGYPMAWLVHHPLSSELFLPLMLFGFERGRSGRSDGWIVLVGAASGSLLGGKLQASLLCFGFVGAYALRRAPRRDGGAGWPTVTLTTVGLGLAGMAAAFLLVPALELVGHASGLTLGGRAQLAAFTVPWPSLASLAVPSLFVAPGRSFADGLLTPGIGIGAVVLAAVGGTARGKTTVGVARFAILWAGVLWLRNAGLFGDLATHLPTIRGILFVKYTFTIVFPLAVAAAIGIDAILAGRIDARHAQRVLMLGLLATAVATAAAVIAGRPPTYPEHLAMPVTLAGAVVTVSVLWRGGLLSRGGIAAGLMLITITDLWWNAPHHHPPRLDPYRAPAFVEYLRGATPGRIIADPDLLVPLTSAAAGLADLRAIDVLTPGSYYAFFTRLVSFCDRVIHFTVDPDVPLAATAPALDLAGVRYVVTRAVLPADDLAMRVRRQVGRERTARLLAGMVRVRTEGAPLAIGPVAVGGEARFAFTLTTPFSFDVTAESEAAELAFGVIARGGSSPVALRMLVEGVPSDAPSIPLAISPGEPWVEQRIALADAGDRRRVRLRLLADAVDGTPVHVSFGDLGFGPGAPAEARVRAERTTRHLDEQRSLRLAFHDPVENVSIYENINALARAFRVRQVEPTGSEESALTRLGDGFEFRRAALVSKADVTAVRAALGGDAAGAAGDEAGTALVRSETPGSMTIATGGPTAAVLVVTDLAYPGWRAVLDGREVPVLTVDGVLRGIVVPSGEHVVTFRYRPRSLLIGIALSVAALVAIAPYARASARLHYERRPT